MPMIKYIQHDGHERTVDVPLGSSVMQGAVDNLIVGVEARCGGACSCATCQVYVDGEWMERVGEAIDDERAMLDAVPNAQSNSRLACQIEITPEMDGLIVRVPAEQY
ncbi:2Fe-2S iron-sulfur cluster-binding protein [Hydrocarboniphaga effusa]|uniref:2Fe-2S iron-sulfur cluster-binding protein n=1 Tax=Hydrocarboniphaga effusa TaxID=243629 RepID=UPI003BAB66B2